MSTALSVIAIVISSTSLGWQVWSWSRTGHAVIVSTTHAYPVQAGHFETDDRMLCVTAHNKGRTAVQVTHWCLEAPDGQTLIPLPPLPVSAPLPYRLEGLSRADWYIRASDAEKACASAGFQVADLRARVTLGTGKSVYAKRRGIGKPG